MSYSDAHRIGPISRRFRSAHSGVRRGSSFQWKVNTDTLPLKRSTDSTRRCSDVSTDGRGIAEIVEEEIRRERAEFRAGVIEPWIAEDREAASGYDELEDAGAELVGEVRRCGADDGEIGRAHV